MPDTTPAAPAAPAAPVASDNPMPSFMAKLDAAGKGAEAPSAPAAPPAAPAPAAPAPAPKPAEPLDLAKLGIDRPTKSDQWREVKAAKEAAERRAAELEAKLAKLGDVDTLMKAQEEAVRLRQQLREVAIERDPEFVSQYTSQRKAHIADAREAVGPELADEVERILERYGEGATPRIRELVKEHNLDQFAATQLSSAIAGLRSTELNRKELVKRTAENWDKNVTEQTVMAQRQAQQAAAQRQAALEAALTAHKDHPLLTPKEGDEEHNAAVNEAHAVAKRVAALELEPDELAQVALMSATYPRVLGSLQSATARIAELEAQLTELRGAQPRAGNGTFAPTGSKGTKLPDLPQVGTYDPNQSVANVWKQVVAANGL